MSTSESTLLTPRTAPPAVDPDDAAMTVALAAVSSAFASLGRVFFCVDASFHVLHASSHLDRLVGDGAAVTDTARGAAPGTVREDRQPSRRSPASMSWRNVPAGPNSSVPSRSARGRSSARCEAPSPTSRSSCDEA